MSNIQITQTETPNIVVTVDRGVAGVGIESVTIVFQDPNYFLEFTYTDGTTELVQLPETVAGVISFNTRIGAVTLTSSDVTTALGYTPPTPTGTGASGTWNIAVSGNAANVTGVVALINGGTGATTQAGARTNLGLGTSAVLNAAVALGTATLDANGTVPLSQIPASIQGGLNYQGTWNASTNTPTLTSSVGSKGYYYAVAVAGSTNLNGITDWNIGDLAVYNGTAWEQIDNTDAVTSVNGFTGSVVLTTTDVAEGTNEYFTTAKARSSVSAGTGITYNSTTGVITNSLPSLGGDVVGAASSTDNAVARFNGTTGKSIQNSSVIIDDSNNVTGVNSLTATTLVVNDNATLGGSNADSLAVNARITTDLEPATDNARDIGTNGRNWRDGFFGRNLTAATLNATTVDINGGTIDNTTIGASTASTGSFTTLTTSSTVTLNGGTANGVAYLNGSKVLTSGSALTFDGTNLGVNTVATALTNYRGAEFAGTTANTGGFLRMRSSDSSINSLDFTDVNGRAIFTTTNHPVRFGVNDTEQMRLTSTGLGIGTSSPSTKLHTSAFAAISTTIDRVGDFGASLQFVRSGLAGNAALGLANDNALGIYLNNSQVGHWNTTGLGIGTTSPAYQLDVVGIGRFSTRAISPAFYGAGTGITEFMDSLGTTGMYVTGAGASPSNSIRFFSAGNAIATFDASGNLGLVVTPSAWGGSIKAIQMGFAGSTAISGRTDAFQANFTLNAYDTGSNTWVYLQSTTANRYSMVGGQHQWFNAPGGTAGNAISFTQAMTLDASGNLGIGTTTPTTKLTVAGETAGFPTLGTSSGGLFLASNNNLYGLFSGVNGSTGDTWFQAMRNDAATAYNIILNPVGGNVGIGTTSPEDRLDLSNGNLRFKAALGGIGTYGIIRSYNTVVPTNPATAIRFIRDISFFGNDGAICFDTVNTERMRIDSFGNVGIGVAITPNTRLSMRTATATDALIAADNGINTGFKVQFANSLTSIGNDLSAPLALLTNNTEKMRITPDGDVGIGTSSPTAKLDVNGGTNSEMRFTTSGAGYLQVGQFSNGAFIGTSSADPTAGILRFGTAATERMRIDSSGNLGIGTTSPVGKLSVVGDILAPSFNTDTTYVIGIQDAQTNTFVGTKRASLKIQASSAVAGDLGMGAGDLTLKAGDAFYAGTGFDGNVNIIAGRSLIGPSFSSGVVTFNTNNTERMRLDVSGNLGLGITPSAWGQGRAIEVFGQGYGIWNGTASIYSIANAYFNGGFKYANTGAQASHYYQFQGAHVWSTAPSGTAGNAISFTQAMTLDASGNLGIGTTTPGGTTTSRQLTLVGSSTSQITLTGSGSFNTDIGTNGVVGYVAVSGANPLTFYTNSTERMRITSAGDVGIGTASPNASALLDVQSTTKGVRMPNMTTTEKNAIASPAAGLMVFDTTLSKLCVYTGAAWETITSL
jgi:hypothetical protein